MRQAQEVRVRAGSRGPWEWRTNTSPFSAIGDPDGPARFVVEQVGDKDFAIPPGEGFQYNPRNGPPIAVNAVNLPTTDFASIPRYMSWFVSRYGRHTPAALVHDLEIVDRMSFADRKKADRRFLVMMDALEVPPVQSRVMWAAVTLATRRKGTRASEIGIYAWGLLAAAGIVLLIWGIATGSPAMIVVALLGPLLAAVTWGDQYWAGVIAGYALPVVLLPALASLAGYWAYWTIEKSVGLVRGRLAPNRGKELPEPLPYQGR